MRLEVVTLPAVSPHPSSVSDVEHSELAEGALERAWFEAEAPLLLSRESAPETLRTLFRVAWMASALALVLLYALPVVSLHGGYRVSWWRLAFDRAPTAWAFGCEAALLFVLARRPLKPRAFNGALLASLCAALCTCGLGLLTLSRLGRGLLNAQGLEWSFGAAWTLPWAIGAYLALAFPLLPLLCVPPSRQLARRLASSAEVELRPDPTGS